MARYGRGQPPSTSILTAAQLQVPIAGVMALVLPTPMQLSMQAAQGNIATMALSLPTPMQLAISGAVGTGAVAGDMVLSLPTPLVLQMQGSTGTVVVTTGLWSSTDLLARAKFYAQRPAIDESMADSDWYNLMTEANAYWVQRIAAVRPEVLYGPPTQIFTQDQGFSYTFGNDADGNPIYPIGHCEIRQSSFGREWIASADYDNTGDFIISGNTIRFPGGKQKTYTNGPIARWVTPGGTVNATLQPTVNPPSARMLIVATMLVNWATRGGFRDPTPFRNMESSIWFGDPDRGDYGVLGMLKTQHMTQGAEGLSATQGRWWSGLNTGQGYTKV